MGQAKDRPVLTFHAIVYPDAETGEFLAHCLELDLMASGRDAEAVSRDLVDVVTAQIQYAFDHDNLEYLMHPAPEDAWQRFMSAFKSGLRQVTELLPIENGKSFRFQPQLELALAA